jgi:hypothetical protein
MHALHAAADALLPPLDEVETGADPHADAARPTAASAAPSLSDFFTLMPPEYGPTPRPEGAVARRWET